MLHSPEVATTSPTPRRIAALVLGVLLSLTTAIVSAQAAAAATVPVWTSLAHGASIAHRGGPCCAPENTMQAFRNAYAHGVPAIEYDVRILEDGYLGVIHDSTVDRTTSGTGPVTSFTRAEFKALGLPTYGDVLGEFGNKTLMIIEPKVAGTTDVIKAMDGLRARGVAKTSVVISSFERADLVAAEARGYATMWLDFSVAAVAAGHGEWIAPRQTAVTSTLVRDAHARHLRVAPWTITTAAQDSAMLAKGVDAVISDRPRELAAG